MGIQLKKLAKIKTPGQIASTPVKSIVNTVKTEGPALQTEIKDVFVTSGKQLQGLTAEAFPKKTIANAFSSAGAAFKNFIKSV